MTDHDQENGEPLSDEFEPGEDEFEEEQEAPAGAAATEETGKPTKEERTGGWPFRRGAPSEELARPTGSVRGAHAERVHVDDRVSAAFALVAALALILILVGSVIATHLPAGPAPSEAPLPTLSFEAPVTTPSSSASSSASTSASSSASASASSSATASPSPSPSPTAS
jgi:hypothetical protein